MSESAPDLRRIKLDDIVVDDSLNVRDHLSEVAIASYQEVLGDLPPIVVFDTEDGLLLADGFHRVAATRRNERSHITAEALEGTRADAIAFACAANLRHGVPLHRWEKVEAVRRLHQLHSRWGKKKISKTLGLPLTTVWRYLTEIKEQKEAERRAEEAAKRGAEWVECEPSVVVGGQLHAAGGFALSTCAAPAAGAA